MARVLFTGDMQEAFTGGNSETGAQLRPGFSADSDGNIYREEKRTTYADPSKLDFVRYADEGSNSGLLSVYQPGDESILSQARFRAGGRLLTDVTPESLFGSDVGLLNYMPEAVRQAVYADPRRAAAGLYGQTTGGIDPDLLHQYQLAQRGDAQARMRFGINHPDADLAALQAASQLPDGYSIMRAGDRGEALAVGNGYSEYSPEALAGARWDPNYGLLMPNRTRSAPDSGESWFDKIVPGLLMGAIAAPVAAFAMGAGAAGGAGAGGVASAAPATTTAATGAASAVSPSTLAAFGATPSTLGSGFSMMAPGASWGAGSLGAAGAAGTSSLGALINQGLGISGGTSGLGGSVLDAYGPLSDAAYNTQLVNAQSPGLLESAIKSSSKMPTSALKALGGLAGGGQPAGGGMEGGEGGGGYAMLDNPDMLAYRLQMGDPRYQAIWGSPYNVGDIAGRVGRVKGLLEG